MTEAIRLLKRMRRYATRSKHKQKEVKQWENAIKKLYSNIIPNIPGPTGPAGHQGRQGPVGPIGLYYFYPTKAHYRNFLRINDRRKKMYLWEFEDSGYPSVNLKNKRIIATLDAIEWLEQRYDPATYVYFLDGYFFFSDPKMATLFAIRFST